MQPKVIKTLSSKINKDRKTTSIKPSKKINIISTKIVTKNELSKHKSYEIYSQNYPINNNSSVNILSKKSKKYQKGIKNKITRNKNCSNIKVSNDEILNKTESKKSTKNNETNIYRSDNRINTKLYYNGVFFKNDNEKQKNSSKTKKYRGSTKIIQFANENNKINEDFENILSESDSFQEIESIDENSDSKKNNITFNKNSNINKEKCKTQGNDYKPRLKKQSKKKNILISINTDLSNTKKPYPNNNTNPDSDDEVLINDNEFENSKHTQNEKLHETEFPKLSINPFMSEKSNIKTTKNVIINLNNVTKYSKEHHIKSSTFETYNKSSTNPNSSNLSNSNLDNLNNINIYSNDLNNELLLTAKSGNKERFIEILEKVISKDQNKINYQDENGNSALHYSCDEGNLRIVEILLKANCDPNLKNKENKTPLHFSAKRGYFDICKLLIENGALLDVFDNQKNSPLHFACINNNIELLQYFLSKLPQADVKNENNLTPIDLTNNKEIKLLIESYLKTNENSYYKITIHQTSDSKMKKKLEDEKTVTSPKKKI